MSEQSQILLTSLLVLSDWLGSNSDLFPLDPTRNTDGLAENAVASCNLPSPWSPLMEPKSIEDMFSERFNRPSHSIRPFQKAVAEQALVMTEPGLLCVEAPMGEGKTEAAFLAAEILAAKFHQGGLYFALPTQATADSVYARMLAWRDNLPEKEGSTYLSHRHSMEIMASLGSGSEWSWLNGKYRPNLKNLVVGTVDQILMMARKAKYLTLRHLAMAGKVVIIDEIHAYDAYMTTYLERALEWLGAYHVPVVLMSATLPSEKRADLLKAYTKGAGWKTSELKQMNEKLSPWRITVIQGSGMQSIYPDGSSRNRTVTVSMQDDDKAFAEAIATAHAGGCVLMIRDTVGRAIKAYQRLKGMGEDVTLVHSRFKVSDRRILDQSLIDDFGPMNQNRPARIVVATQVAEQSLDVDFDLLISDIAPIDLLLQRAGRLFRHERCTRKVHEARLMLTGFDGYPEGIDKVYSPWVLDQTMKVVSEHKQWDLPTDIPVLVEAVYSAVATGETGRRFKKEIKSKQAEAKRTLIPHAHLWNHCLDGWLNNAMTGSVRDGGPVVEAYLDSRDQANLLQLSESALGYLPVDSFSEYAKAQGWVSEDEDIIIPSNAMPFTIDGGLFTYAYDYSSEYGWTCKKAMA